ncbi:MAG: DUF4412 domain-containing protein [Bacteroidetes bacterium]|nr:DUF4412 domain-containing protein [Bacteroidota bacterium]MBS1974093.1 DUF4412 domain-containing protein [Bacteroidota bacterium]
MKYLKLFSAILLSTSLFCSCSGNNNNDKQNGSGATLTTSGGSGSDTYLESSMKTTSKNIKMDMLQKIYLSHNGKARIEMYKIEQGKPSLIMIGISDVSKPTQSILIDDSAKTYSINKIDTAARGGDILDEHTKYTVSKIGSESIQGLNCVHAQILKTMNFSGVKSFLNSEDTIDVWMTKDIPMPAVMQKSFAKGMGLAYNANVANQLEQMGCVGFPAKFQSHGKAVTVVSQLNKISHDNFPAAMFEVPSGYKQTAGF